MQFYIVDVFAEQKYQGNPLAVLLPNKTLSTTEMQQIAKEINFSETTFILSKQRVEDGYNVRIFTPDTEVPFAGHPTLGTAFIINEILENQQASQIILNLPIGPIPVNFLNDEKNELLMEQQEPVFGKIFLPTILAEILQISSEDINTQFPIQAVSTGLPAVIVPLKTIEAVKKCAVNHDKFQQFIASEVKANLLVFTPQALQKGNDLHARVFMDDPGFLEDPATGSANGNLAAYLLNYNFFNSTKLALNIEQGYQIGRPSLLKIKAEKLAEKFKIHIGGKVFMVAKGEWLC